MTASIIALGANLSQNDTAPGCTLVQALRMLLNAPCVIDVRESRLYRTPAYPPGNGPDFVNAAAVVEAALSPTQLLTILHEIEAALGRERRTRWSPRTCDLDLIGAGDLVLPDRPSVEHWMGLSDDEVKATSVEHLILPHPRAHLRAFVLVPLADVAPDWRHPVLGRTVSEMCADLPEADRAEVVPLA